MNAKVEENITAVYSLIYVLMSACLVCPPKEVRTAGLSLQNILSSWLGSEELFFIQYHVRRATATVLFHSLLPLGYYIGLIFVNPSLELWNVWRTGLFWQLFLSTSLIFTAIIIILVYHWSRNGWSNHPISKSLSNYGSRWNTVSSSINIEMRRVDKFTSGTPSSRVYVTDTWVLKTSTYHVYIAQQQDIHLNLEASENHTIAAEHDGPLQVLNIRVESINPAVTPFTIRLNSMEYAELREKLQAPVRNARSIVVRQTLSEQFVDAFRQQVILNEVYSPPHDAPVLEACIGCMRVTADCKLQKLCNDQSQGDCQHCYCRPMWCIDCMGRWFASRQNQQEPETWMSSKSPCPTCRSKFCVLDVSRIS